MVIKEENTRRIQELEAEFSDEKIAELFYSDDDLKEKKRIRKRREARNSAIRLSVFAAVVAVVCLLLLFNPKITYEDSMEDTIIPKDMIMLSVMAYQKDGAEVSFGDVIVHRSAMMDDQGNIIEVCSRVIGIPGDVIEIRDGYVYRNNERLDEPYTKDGRTDGKMLQLSIPDRYYFILGDNRQNSVDSRDHRIGLVNGGQIEGKVVFRLLPISRIGKIE